MQVEFLELISSRVRLKILEQITNTETTVNDLAEMLNLTASATSQHLAKLRAANLVDTRPDRNQVYYRCTSPAIRQILSVLGHLHLGKPVGDLRPQSHH